MNSNELSNVLLEIVKMYFAGADVIWSQRNNTQRKKPCVALKLRSAGRATHSSDIQEDDVLRGYIPSKSILQIDLFTNGKKTDVGGGMLPIFENTAVADLEDFCNFVVSQKVTEICDEENITISQKGDVIDVTALLDGVDNEFRAQVELEVDYMQEVTGAYGVSVPMFTLDDEDTEDSPSNDTEDTSNTPSAPFVPTPSGGRTEEQVNTEIGYFVEVETESEEE